MSLASSRPQTPPIHTSAAEHAGVDLRVHAAIKEANEKGNTPDSTKVALEVIRKADSPALLATERRKCNEYEFTVLDVAAMYGNPALVEGVCNRAGPGHTLRTPEALSNALCWAAVNNDSPEIAELLLSANATVDARTAFGGTAPIHFASLNKSENVESVLDVLLKAGAEVDARSRDNQTALKIAIDQSENEKTALKLIDSGADLNLRHEGRSYLDSAAYHLRVGVANRLLDKGLKPNTFDNGGYDTVCFFIGSLRRASENRKGLPDGAPELILRLLPEGACFFHILHNDPYLASPLINAMASKCTAEDSTLLDPTLPLAAKYGLNDTVKLLLKQNCNPDLLNRSFELAAQHNHRDTAKLLLQAGAKTTELEIAREVYSAKLRQIASVAFGAISVAIFNWLSERSQRCELVAQPVEATGTLSGLFSSAPVDKTTWEDCFWGHS